MMPAEAIQCPECGAPIPADAPAGQCVACLLRLAGPEPPKDDPPPAPLPGATLGYFGDYELVRELGRGGMGVVYEARQRSLNRPVALKLLLAGEFAGEVAIARFKEEAELVASLDHPNIVPIYEVGEHDARHFYSMKLIPGHSLAHGAGRFRADLRASASLIMAVARAVHHAHQRGVIHRDLSPENILVDADGTPFVTDFGLARLMERSRRLTQTQGIVGKPDYMAPEQAGPQTRHLTTGSDLFSLGVILYELLTGTRPFTAPTPLATVERIRTDNPAPPGRLNPSVDRDLATITLKCLEKDPQHRYDSAAALADDLQRWLRHEPIAARPVGAVGRVWKWTRRHPWRAAFGLATLLAIIGPLATAVTYLLLINSFRSSHMLKEFQDGRLELPITDHNSVRCTDGFSTWPFHAPGRTVRVEFANMPDHLRSNLTVILRSDWAGLPDPALSPPLRHGDRFHISIQKRRRLSDWHLYFAETDWRATNLVQQAPGAAILLSIADQRP